MKLINVADQFLNMDLLIEAELDVVSRDDVTATLVFAAPAPASVGASDWSTGTHRVRFDGKDARAVLDWLLCNSEEVK